MTSILGGVWLGYLKLASTSHELLMNRFQEENPHNVRVWQEQGVGGNWGMRAFVIGNVKHIVRKTTPAPLSAPMNYL